MTNPQSTSTANPNEGETTHASQANSAEFIPKDQHTAALNAHTSELSSLKQSLEEAQSTLMSPDYLKYLADKKATSRQASSAAASTSPSDKDLRDRLSSLEVIASQLAATIELNEVERKYPDFNDHRSDVQAILRSNGNLSFEQAYLVAKGRKPGSVPAPSAATPSGDKQTSGTEKPGKFVPNPDVAEKEFKSASEASLDAARQIREKYGISDIL